MAGDAAREARKKQRELEEGRKVRAGDARAWKGGRENVERARVDSTMDSSRARGARGARGDGLTERDARGMIRRRG